MPLWRLIVKIQVVRHDKEIWPLEVNYILGSGAETWKKLLTSTLSLRGIFSMRNLQQRTHKTFLALACAAITTPALAGSLETEFSDIRVSGGASGGYVYADSEITRQTDQSRLMDFLLGIDASTRDGRAEISAGVGILPAYALMDEGVDEAGSGAEVQYAEVIVHPSDSWTLELGKMPSNVGFEDTIMYNNANVMESVQAITQPGFFNAARLSYGNDNFSVYAEQGDEEYEAPSGATSGQSWSAGAMGSAGGVEYVVGYHGYAGLRTLFDLIVSGNVGGMDVTVAVDRLKLEDAALASPTDTNHAESIAIYVSGPTAGEFSFPIRIEAFDDHSNGLYGNSNGGAGKGNSLTITPTWNISENAFLRSDISYLKTDNKIFNDKGTMKDSRMGIALQAGYRL